MRSPARLRGGLATASLLLLLGGGAAAEPIAVRYPEGVTRAFPVLRALDGRVLAWGDLVQTVRGDVVESRLVFRFEDGSLHDETVAFSQRERFRLLAYRLVQRGPAFPETLEATIDRASGRYRVRHRADEESPEEELAGTFALPEDAYNGMLAVVVRNLLGPEPAAATVSLVAFTPRPRTVRLHLTAVATERVRLGDRPLEAVRYALRPDLGLFASLLLVAEVPEVRMWVVPGEAPAFVRAEGPLYFLGPVWRIEPY